MRALAVALLALAAGVNAQVAVPPVARVTDLTGTLTPAQRAGLDARLAAFESRKGSQIAVLVVPTTQPETIEQYAIRVADAWQLGRQGIDDGALLVVAKDDRRLRIEVGHGLEGAIPDAIAKRIVAETITPYFRSDDFYGGIAAGVEQIAHVIEGETLPDPERASPRDGERYDSVLTLIGVLAVMSLVFGRAMGVLPAAATSAAILGAVGWFMFGALTIALGVAALMFMISLFLQIWSSAGVSGAVGGRRGGIPGGGFGGGFGGGGGFRGGGGGFGGGGASGGW